jgi:hypothetical protein
MVIDIGAVISVAVVSALSVLRWCSLYKGPEICQEYGYSFFYVRGRQYHHYICSEKKSFCMSGRILRTSTSTSFSTHTKVCGIFKGYNPVVSFITEIKSKSVQTQLNYIFIIYYMHISVFLPQNVL